MEDDEESQSQDNESYCTTLVQLIEDICSESSITGNATLRLEALHTMKTIAPEMEFFEKIVDRYNTSNSEIVKIRCVSFLRTWVDEYGDKILHLTDLTNKIETFCYKIISDYPDLAPMIESMSYANISSKWAVMGFRLVPDLTNLLDFDFMETSSLVIAQQLTLIEYSFYSRIRPWELVGTAWEKNALQNAPNVHRMMKWFDAINLFVSSFIICQSQSKKRARALAKIIEVIEHLVKLQNYNGMVEFVSALESSMMSNQKSIWLLLPKNLKVSYENSRKWCGLVDNFKKLRKHLETAEVPFIPYIGLYLRDLIYVEELHPDKFNGKINWGKRKAQSKIINHVLRSNQASFDFEPIQKVQDYFFYKSRWSSDVLFNLSNYIKNEETAFAKQKDMTRENLPKELDPRPRQLMTRNEKKNSSLHVLATGLDNSGKTAFCTQQYGFSDTPIPRREITKFKELITKYTYATLFEFLQCISSHLEEIMDSLIDTDISVIEERAKKRWNSTDDNAVKSSMRSQSSPIKKLSSCDPRYSPSPKKKSASGKTIKTELFRSLDKIEGSDSISREKSPKKLKVKGKSLTDVFDSIDTVRGKGKIDFDAEIFSDQVEKPVPTELTKEIFREKITSPRPTFNNEKEVIQFYESKIIARKLFYEQAMLNLQKKFLEEVNELQIERDFTLSELSILRVTFHTPQVNSDRQDLSYSSFLSIEAKTDCGISPRADSLNYNKMSSTYDPQKTPSPSHKKKRNSSSNQNRREKNSNVPRKLENCFTETLSPLPSELVPFEKGLETEINNIFNNGITNTTSSTPPSLDNLSNLVHNQSQSDSPRATLSKKATLKNGLDMLAPKSSRSSMKVAVGELVEKLLKLEEVQSEKGETSSEEERINKENRENVENQSRENKKVNEKDIPKELEALEETSCFVELNSIIDKKRIVNGNSLSDGESETEATITSTNTTTLTTPTTSKPTSPTKSSTSSSTESFTSFHISTSSLPKSTSSSTLPKSTRTSTPTTPTKSSTRSNTITAIPMDLNLSRKSMSDITGDVKEKEDGAQLESPTKEKARRSMERRNTIAAKTTFLTTSNTPTDAEIKEKMGRIARESGSLADIESTFQNLKKFWLQEIPNETLVNNTKSNSHRERNKSSQKPKITDNSGQFSLDMNNITDESKVNDIFNYSEQQQQQPESDMVIDMNLASKVIIDSIVSTDDNNNSIDNDINNQSKVNDLSNNSPHSSQSEGNAVVDNNSYIKVTLENNKNHSKVSNDIANNSPQKKTSKTHSKVSLNSKSHSKAKIEKGNSRSKVSIDNNNSSRANDLTIHNESGIDQNCNKNCNHSNELNSCVSSSNSCDKNSSSSLDKGNNSSDDSKKEDNQISNDSNDSDTIKTKSIDNFEAEFSNSNWRIRNEDVISTNTKMDEIQLTNIVEENNIAHSNHGPDSIPKSALNESNENIEINNDNIDDNLSSKLNEIDASDPNLRLISTSGSVSKRRRSRSNSPSSKKKVLEAKGEFDVKKLRSAIQERLNFLNEQADLFQEDNQTYIDNLCDEFLKLWTYPTIRQLLEDDSQFDRNVTYYFDQLKRLSNVKYEPSVSDIVFFRRPTNGIFRYEGKVQGQPYQFTDVGGRLAERKKWDRLISENNFNAIIHFVSLDEYDIYDEFEKQNRLDLALNVWIETTQSCVHTPFFLVFNKRESFKKKLKKTPFTVFRTEFLTAMAQNCDFCVDYIVDLFKGNFKGNFVIPLVTEVTNSEEVGKIINLVTKYC